jgi:hypothetical protein
MGMIQQTPQGQAIMAAMQAHINEHLAFAYRKEVEQTVGLLLPTEEQEKNMTPEVAAQVAQLSAQASMRMAQQAQAQYQPLIGGAQGLMNLGNQYIAQNPNDVAARYIQNQQNLLQPSRDVANANLQNQLQNTGRTGLAVAQGGNLGQANPEAQALANAQAMQDLQLAAQGQQMGQQNTLFGANLLGQGAGALGNYYAGQSAAYQPYQSAFGAMTGLENLAQQPLSLSSSLGQQSATAGANAGRNYLSAIGLGAGYGTSNAATVSPGGTLLSGLGPSIGQGLGNWLGSGVNSGVQGFGQTNPISGEFMGSLEF